MNAQALRMFGMAEPPLYQPMRKEITQTVSSQPIIKKINFDPFQDLLPDLESFSNTTPLASKGHCSLNVLKNSSTLVIFRSPKSQVQSP